MVRVVNSGASRRSNNGVTFRSTPLDNPTTAGSPSWHTWNEPVVHAGTGVRGHPSTLGWSSTMGWSALSDVTIWRALVGWDEVGK